MECNGNIVASYSDIKMPKIGELFRYKDAKNWRAIPWVADAMQ